MTQPNHTLKRDRGPSTADICVVGGAGHVGLGFSIILASKGKRILILDVNTEAMDSIQKGNMPFLEYDAEPMLHEALASRKLLFSSNVADIATVPTIIITIGTPIDEFLNPDMMGFIQCFEEMLPYLSNEHLLILRSTVYPGMTRWLERFFHGKGLHPRIAFCPERVVEGHAIRELQTLPQIVSGTTLEAENDAAEVFSWIAPTIVRLEPMEAEFAKLFANAYRYIQFAITNQFYMMANSAGLDYYRILEGIKQDYPRLRDIPKAGYAAGPCLLKDTMQLTAFSNNMFSLGNSAMLINEGLPLYVVSRIEQKYHLHEKIVGLLGMAFKADSDDPRTSLSYKLKKLLKLKAKGVLTTDPLVRGDADLLSLEEVVEQSDILILAVPHSAYLDVNIHNKPIVDIWNFFGGGQSYMKARLRVGVVGIGFGQKVLVPAFAAEPHCRVEGICASDLQRARRAADRLDLPKAYGGWEELVADPDIDVVGIAAPPLLQPAIAVASLANGKHVFCEKPIAGNLEGAGQMLAAARTHARAHMVDFEFPEVPVWQRAKAILDSGTLGRLTHVTVSWQVETYASRMGTRSWKTDARMGGGALNSFVSHSFYYLEWLAGPIRRLAAHLFSPGAALATGHGDTLAGLWLEHQNGVVSSLCVSSSAFLGTGHRVEIYGQQGSVLLNNPSRDYVSGFSLWHGTRETNKLERLCSGENEDSETDGRIAPVNSLVKRFVRWVREGIRSTPDIEDGYRVQLLLDAACRSHLSGRKIELE